VRSDGCHRIDHGDRIVWAPWWVRRVVCKSLVGVQKGVDVMYSVNARLEKLKPKCQRYFYQKWGVLIAEAEIPSGRNQELLARVMRDITCIVREAGVEDCAAGFWKDGLGVRYRARLSGNETKIRSRLQARGWVAKSPRSAGPGGWDSDHRWFSPAGCHADQPPDGSTLLGRRSAVL